MSESQGVPLLVRPSFFDGQRLSAHDLAEVQRIERELRWLHNRSLHDWGIALGLEVAGERDARVATVRPGYALDSLGRELVLFEEVSLPVPAVAGTDAGGPRTYLLTASYYDDADLAPEIRAGSCGTAGAVRRPERARLRWQDPDDSSDPATRYRRGLDIVLAAVKVKDCKLAAGVSAAERRDARPAAQPYVAAGRTAPGDTTWRFWPETAPMAVETVVVTADAGFRGPPAYQAHVAGKRVYERDGSPVVIDGTAQIADASASSFIMRVMLPAGFTAGASRMVLVTRDDYRAVIAHVLDVLHAGGHIGAPTSAIVDSVTTFVLKGKGPRLAVGKRITLSPHLPLVGVQIFSFGYYLTADDLDAGLERIAAREGITRDELVDLNFASPEDVAIEIDVGLRTPGAAGVVNPANALDGQLLDDIRATLGWHVVWLGVEGGGA